MKCPFNRQKYDIKSWHISIQTQCKCQHHIKNSIKFDRIICSNPLYRCFLISKSDELLAKISNKVIHFCGDQSERSVCISRTKYCLMIDKFQVWHCIVCKISWVTVFNYSSYMQYLLLQYYKPENRFNITSINIQPLPIVNSNTDNDFYIEAQQLIIQHFSYLLLPT